MLTDLERRWSMCGNRTYYNPNDGEDSQMRLKLRTMLSDVQTDTAQVESVISRFEDRLDALMSRLDNLESRVSRIERRLDI